MEIRTGDKWKRMMDIKVIERYSVSLVMNNNNNLFVIGGMDKEAKESRKIEQVMLDSKEVVLLPDLPIDGCWQRQTAFVSCRNQIVVGYEKVNILDLYQQNWQQYDIDNGSFAGLRRKSYIWIDEDTPDLIFIGTTQIIRWTDIRENNPKWTTLWNTPLDKFVKLYSQSSFESFTPYLMFPNH